MIEWNIQSRAHGCEACGKLFADQEAFHTLLFDEKADLRRLDICSGCWDKQYREARDRKGFISYWQGKYEAPPAPTDAIKKETAETLLLKLVQLNDPRHIPAGYILAVMLERKRVLKIKEQFVRNGQRVFIYEQPKSGDVFTIADPDLHLDQLEQVQREVAALLEHGLEPASARPADPAIEPETPVAETNAIPVPPEPMAEPG
ncbi:MAG TPA: hypothetical protein VFD66_14085 [Verrucomicrobiae bacterium]|nr:hypothetical protein [Verrucomicrobiae bacterium]